MNNSKPPLHEWLGRPSDTNWLHYYDLLGLPPLISDTALIRQTANELFQRVKSCHPGPHEKARRQLLLQIKAAHDCLTNAESKSAYDFKVRAREHKIPSPTNPPPASLRSPPDPMAPVTPELLDSLAPVSPPPPRAGSSNATAFPPTAVPVAKPIVSSTSPTSVPREQASVGNAEPIVQVGLEHRHPHLRYRRKKSVWPTIVVTCLLLAGCGGFGWLLYERAAGHWGRARQSSPTANLSSLRTADTSEAPAARDTFAPETPTSQERTSTDTSRAVPELPIPPPDSSDTTAPLPSSPTEPVNPEKYRPLSTALVRFRDSLSDGQLPLAKRHLGAATDLVRHPRHRPVVQRAESLLAGVTNYWNFVRTAMQNLDAGQSFQLENKVVLVVEGEEDFIIVRSAGQNKRFEFDEMPLAMTMALVDLHQNESATRETAKALVLATSPETDRTVWEAMLNRADQLGGNTQDIRTALTEDYSPEALAALIP